ncbi:hypothetical protein EB796_019605 [Bugula neritina]|uniref:Signal peptidase complex subunit 2 n=1 Tax=Bugula neritina TaxID=10212 RepID=A0A7J7J8N0_BUGNE|nr:hypothetical protein EB796_019605 [Bugula neritina]
MLLLLSLSVVRYDDIYELTIEYKDGNGSSNFRETKLQDSVTKFFDEKGTLREDLFCPQLKQICRSLQKDKKDK